MRDILLDVEIECGGDN